MHGKDQKHAWDEQLSNKLKQLHGLMSQLQPGILAVSGGLDSRFLAHLADHWGLDYLAIFFSGPHMTRKEKMFAENFLQGLNIPFYVLEINPLEQPQVAANEAERCYFCKRFLFRSIREQAGSRRKNILEGSHLSDLSEYRPGQRALRELGVISPLYRAGFYKQEIRECARYFNLPHPEQASRPCMLTRFDYGYSPQSSELEQIAEAEDKLWDLGLREFRIRVLADKYYLQVQDSEQNLCSQKQAEIEQILSSTGLSQVQIFSTSRISGFFDQVSGNSTGELGS